MGLDKIAKISNCYIFASFIDKSDRETFSLRICYKNEHVPLIIVHPKKPLHKKCKNSPIKVGWIIVGQPINFDFDQTKYPVVLKRINNQYKIESSKHEEVIKSCILNTCVFGRPEIDYKYLVSDEKVSLRTALFCCLNDIDKSHQTCEFDQIIINWQKEQNLIQRDPTSYQNFIFYRNRKKFCFFT
ncbi:hypothetical protein C2G38_1397462 [Gigaspora rosea]|uniref:DUF7431 domain-containing protein n=1 Tax=Gigaspora rosea TaxID=44941 RepID=A0A397W8P0_9GLOM|nr:hypothetical protein C2G38_1397462 [Gigaspora rosea]